MTKNMYTVAGDSPCNEELALRIQAGDKNAAERLISQNEGYLTGLARAYTPWCELEDLKQKGAMALLDAARRFDPACGTKLLTYATPAIEAALSDYAAQYAFPLFVPASRGSQLRAVAYLCAEAQDTSETELTKAVCEKLKVSSKAAEVLLKEYRTLFCVQQLGDDVFSVSCGGDPAVAYDRLMRRTLLMQRMEEVLTPRELNLVRSYLAIGQPDEVGSPEGLGTDIGKRRLHGRPPAAPALVLGVDHQMPDEVSLFVIVIDDHQISDHLTSAADRKGRTLTVVYIRLGQTPDRVGYEFLLLGL